MNTVTDAGDSAGGVDVDSYQHTAPTVLIVDDDGAARLALCGLLWSEGYRIAFSVSADDARERLSDIKPDVILCDLIMQGTNGDEFCGWLKSHAEWCYVPVIAVTCVNNTVATAALLDAGADDVIIKPVKARELQARVAAAMRTRERYVSLLRAAEREAAAPRETKVVREAAALRQPCVVRDASANRPISTRSVETVHTAALA